ncbi:hypothetical protein KJ959_09080 [bacterium]|nr:hypothetical protein [Candidatus Omnitrophota bacterium]MBU4123811.1 hypothetical protein [bacterium]
MSLKQLLKDQKIRIDDHSRGSGQPIEPENVHLHKSFTGKKNKGKKIIIYINRPNNNIEFYGNFSGNEKDKIMSEIRRVLSRDKAKLKLLIDMIFEALAIWRNNNIGIEKAREIANNLAAQFGLGAMIHEEFVNRIEGKLKEVISIHLDEQKKTYWISQRKDRILAGDGRVSFIK